MPLERFAVGQRVRLVRPRMVFRPYAEEYGLIGETAIVRAVYGDGLAGVIFDKNNCAETLYPDECEEIEDGNF